MKSAEEVKDKVLIFVKWITTRSGQRIYASQRGKKAFAIWVTPR